jgi:hypothetical protein
MSNSTSDTIHAMVGQLDSVLSLFLLIHGFTLTNIIFYPTVGPELNFTRNFQRSYFI